MASFDLPNLSGYIAHARTRAVCIKQKTNQPTNENNNPDILSKPKIENCILRQRIFCFLHPFYAAGELTFLVSMPQQLSYSNFTYVYYTHSFPHLICHFTKHSSNSPSFRYFLSIFFPSHRPGAIYLLTPPALRPSH